jgi:hypothetical protein
MELHPLEQNQGLGMAEQLLEMAHRFTSMPEANQISIPRTVDGRNMPSRVAAVFDRESDTFFHVLSETDPKNQRETAHIAWFSLGEHAGDNTDGCVSITQEYGGTAQMTGSSYERFPVQNRQQFWDGIGPTTYTSRLEHPEPNDKPLTDEQTQSMTTRLNRSRIDSQRSEREGVMVSVDNMIRSDDFKKTLDTEMMYERLRLFGIPEETISGLHETNFTKRYIARAKVAVQMLPRILLANMAQAMKDDIDIDRGSHGH